MESPGGGAGSRCVAADGTQQRRRPGDAEAAFERYVLPELEVLYRFARSRTRDPVAAEDLVQDTLLRAFRAIDRFDGRHPRAWLLTIMRNAHLSDVRRKRPVLLRDADLSDQIDRPAGRLGHSAEDEVIAGQFDHEVEVAYRALPDAFREVIDVVDLGGLSYDAAATVLDIPVGTVMSRLHRGRRRIRHALTAPPPTGTTEEVHR
jgi:RNA polymerase sigma-70 factor (ECF subfamily)